MGIFGKRTKVAKGGKAGQAKQKTLHGYPVHRLNPRIQAVLAEKERRNKP